MPRSGSARWRPAALGWLRSSPGGLIALALLVGVLAGFGAIVFRWLISTATLVFSGQEDYAAVTDRPPHPWFPWLGAGFVVLAPAIGGLIYGPLVNRFAPEARGHGVPEVMLAVARRGGRIPLRVAAVKSLASAICIGSGGSVGREGPIVQIGSALASSMGQTLRMPEGRLRALVACGAAGGIAATFNAPLAGVFFALELLLRNFAAESFGAVVLSSVTASVIGRAVLGDEPFLELPVFTVQSGTEYLLYAMLGLLAGGVGVAFTRVLYAVEDVCNAVWRGPEWARPAVGGLLLGLLLLAVPQLYGVGYPVLEDGVLGRLALTALILLMLGKMLATSLTIGIGGSGGVFAPSLFIGAMFGAAFGDIASRSAGFEVGPVGAYALVGMGAVFAGAARAPITAVVILFELTGQYSIILPLMLAIVLSTAASRAMSRDTIYSLKLRRRGINLDEHAGDPRLREARVRDIMQVAPPPISPTSSVAETADAIMRSGRPAAPVVEDGRLVGVVSAQAVSATLSDDEQADSLMARDIMHQPVSVHPDTTLADALGALVGADAIGMPVTVRGEQDGAPTVVGWLTQRAVLSVVSDSTGPHPGPPRVADWPPT